MIRYLHLMLAASAIGCQTASTANLPVHHDGLETERATAVNLRVDSGVFIESSNLLSITPQIAAGTRARLSTRNEKARGPAKFRRPTRGR